MTRRLRVLRDRRHDRRLAVDGFVVIDVADDTLRNSLRADFEELNRRPAVGFDPDLDNPDVEYRREVADRLASRLTVELDRHLVAHDAFLWNFLTKWPGEQEPLYLHRDWMFVDESAGHRSYLVWMPLRSVGDEDGVLQVLPGSHRLRGPLTGTDLAPSWLEHRERLSDHLVDVPVAEGCAVVLDHALLHASRVNQTSEPRVVVGAAVAPRGAPLVHYRCEDRGPVRYQVDQEFFVTWTPTALRRRAPSEYPSHLVGVKAQPTLSPDEVVRRSRRRRWLQVTSR